MIHIHMILDTILRLKQTVGFLMLPGIQ